MQVNPLISLLGGVALTVGSLIFGKYVRRFLQTLSDARTKSELETAQKQTESLAQGLQAETDKLSKLDSG